MYTYICFGRRGISCEKASLAPQRRTLLDAWETHPESFVHTPKVSYISYTERKRKQPDNANSQRPFCEVLPADAADVLRCTPALWACHCRALRGFRKLSVRRLLGFVLGSGAGQKSESMFRCFLTLACCHSQRVRVSAFRCLGLDRWCWRLWLRASSCFASAAVAQCTFSTTPTCTRSDGNTEFMIQRVLYGFPQGICRI